MPCPSQTSGFNVPNYVRCNEIIFPCTRKVLKLFCTLSVTTATPERSFSTLRYLKTYLRSTMTADRLNGLALMYIHKNVEVKAHEVLDEMSKKPRRLLLWLAARVWPTRSTLTSHRLVAPPQGPTTCTLEELLGYL
ncbi:hypothetical protein ANN_27164 [Periplaneta americana]|uniref:HAT C-terminal dimerisation domain-containing protein n=1 Tax=Periplaneta americana TaxID=6978 RepID=A0ABQ8RXJ2_PERAM|nr:hypothetical protein ANN_27164 [Periplaneta americana]